MRLRTAAASAAMLFITGCNTTQYGETNLAGPPQEGSVLAKHLPSNYRQIIANDLKTWPDYQGMIIREARISNGKTQFGDIMRGGTTATVCVNYKTRNALGQEGYFMEAFFFTNGELAHGDRRSAAVLACSTDRVFGPFPEANTT